MPFQKDFSSYWKTNSGSEWIGAKDCKLPEWSKDKYWKLVKSENSEFSFQLDKDNMKFLLKGPYGDIAVVTTDEISHLCYDKKTQSWLPVEKIAVIAVNYALRTARLIHPIEEFVPAK